MSVVCHYCFVLKHVLCSNLNFHVHFLLVFVNVWKISLTPANGPVLDLRLSSIQFFFFKIQLFFGGALGVGMDGRWHLYSHTCYFPAKCFLYLFDVLIVHQLALRGLKTCANTRWNSYIGDMNCNSLVIVWRNVLKAARLAAMFEHMFLDSYAYGLVRR